MLMNDAMRSGFGGGPALYVSEDDWPALEAALRERLASSYTFPNALIGAPMLYGVRVHRSHLIPSGRMLLVEPSGRPRVMPVTSWSEVLTTITALGLAGVDEKVG